MEQTLKDNVATLVSFVDQLEVTDALSLQTAGFYGRRLRAMIENVKQYYKPIKQSLDSKHIDICAEERGLIDDLTFQETVLTTAILKYKDKKEAELEKSHITPSHSIVSLPKGFVKRKDWELVSVEDDKVPVKWQGKTIRPIHRSSILALIRREKGNVKIPGVEFREIEVSGFKRS